VRRLVKRALAKDPAARITDGAALVAAIDDLAVDRDDSRSDTLVMPAVRVEHATQVLPLGADSPAEPGPVADEAGSTEGAWYADADPETEEDRPRRRLLVPLLVALVVVAAVAAGALILGMRGDPAPASAPPATPPPAPTTSATPLAPQAPPVVRVRLTAEEYVGRPVGQVQPQLAGLDLAVRLVPVETADVPAGQVLAVDPVGEVPVGTTVTVTHAVAPPPPPPPPPTVAPTTEAEPTQGNGKEEQRERRRERQRERERNRD
jgi:eukaryotic-like serine/threonine-protein kinase